jgi:hypothetical protein
MLLFCWFLVFNVVVLLFAKLTETNPIYVLTTSFTRFQIFKFKSLYLYLLIIFTDDIKLSKNLKVVKVSRLENGAQLNNSKFIFQD